MSHVLRVGVADQIAGFQAFNNDGSIKTDLTASTAGLTISVFRAGLAPVSISSLSDKAADNTPHADGAIRYVGDSDYTIDLPDAAAATQCPHIQIRGTFTGGYIKGDKHPIVAYDPTLAAVGANTTTPPTASANATAVRTELATELADIVSAEDRTSLIYSLLQLTDTDVATLLARIAGTIRTAADDVTAETAQTAAIRDGLALEATLTSIKGSGFDGANDSLAAIRAAVDAVETSALTGPWTRTITVTDSVSGLPIESAIVRFFRTGETESKPTNSSGVASFTVETATWSYAIVANGYAGVSGSVVVSASGDTAVGMVASGESATYPPGSPGL